MPREHVLRVSHISIFSSIARIEGIGISLSLSLYRLYELDAFERYDCTRALAATRFPTSVFAFSSRLARKARENRHHYHPHSITSRSRHAIANDFDANTFNSIGSPRSTDCSTAHDLHRPHYFFSSLFFSTRCAFTTFDRHSRVLFATNKRKRRNNIKRE